MEKTSKKQKTKEPYVRLEIQSEDVEMGAYGGSPGGGGEPLPVAQLSPFFGLCPPCP